MRNPKSNQRAATMRDVAKLAGVSQSTVSRVLSQTTSSIPISEETYRKVYDAIEKLGYRPNMTARSLRTQRAYMIAVMIADISNAFYHSITRTIQDFATHHNYDVIIANTDHIAEYEHRFLEAMMRRPVDGIIAVPYHLTSDDLDQLIQRTGVPVAALARHISHPMIDTVSADDETAICDTVQWLIKSKGHRDIGFIGVEGSFPVGIRRLRGYQTAMKDLPARPEWVQTGNFSPESGYLAMQQLLSLKFRPTAVVACNDLMAIGAINAALDMKYRVPEDIAIIGFDNIPVGTLIRPRLTTIAQFPVEMGQKLAEVLFQRIEKQYEGESRKFDIPCRLIERDST